MLELISSCLGCKCCRTKLTPQPDFHVSSWLSRRTLLIHPPNLLTSAPITIGILDGRDARGNTWDVVKPWTSSASSAVLGTDMEQCMCVPQNHQGRIESVFHCEVNASAQLGSSYLHLLSHPIIPPTPSETVSHWPWTCQLASLTGQQAPGIYLPLRPQPWIYKYMIPHHTFFSFY